jgi:hypothetical protein
VICSWAVPTQITAPREHAAAGSAKVPRAPSNSATHVCCAVPRTAHVVRSAPAGRGCGKR